MKFILPIIAIFMCLVTFSAFAGFTPYCNIAEIVDGMPTNAQIAEFKKESKLEIVTRDNAAYAIAEWNETFQIYQIILVYGELSAITLVEKPGKSGFINLQDSKRNFQAQCRFEGE